MPRKARWGSELRGWLGGPDSRAGMGELGFQIQVHGSGEQWMQEVKETSQTVAGAQVWAVGLCAEAKGGPGSVGGGERGGHGEEQSMGGALSAGGGGDVLGETCSFLGRICGVSVSHWELF